VATALVTRKQRIGLHQRLFAIEIVSRDDRYSTECHPAVIRSLDAIQQVADAVKTQSLEVLHVLLADPQLKHV
jgi:hypothetical protein